MPQHLSKGQAMRLHYALDFTLESMAMCGVPPTKRPPEMEKVANEMLDLFETSKDEFPESPTERLWKGREVNHWRYSARPNS